MGRKRLVRILDLKQILRFSDGFSAFQEACVVEASYTPKPNLFLSTFRFEHFTHSAARNSFAFHGIASEDDFGVLAGIPSGLTFSKHYTALP